MSARADKRSAGDANGVRRRQLLLFSVIAAVVLVAVAAWLGMGGGKTDAPQGGIDAGIVERIVECVDVADMVAVLVNAGLVCSLRTAGEHRSHAGCRGAPTSIHAAIAAADSTRQSGPRCPL